MARVKITLDRKDTWIDIPKEGPTLLTAALEKGLDAPYSCRGGVCTTCRAKLLSGKVRMDANHALSDREVAEGHILACQSHPETDEVHITWDI